MLLFALLEGLKIGKSTLENMEVPRKRENITIPTRNLLLGVYPQKMKALSERDIFIAIVPYIQIWKSHKYLVIGWMDYYQT